MWLKRSSDREALNRKLERKFVVKAVIALVHDRLLQVFSRLHRFFFLKQIGVLAADEREVDHAHAEVGLVDSIPMPEFESVSRLARVFAAVLAITSFLAKTTDEPNHQNP